MDWLHTLTSCNKPHPLFVIQICAANRRKQGLCNVGPINHHKKYHCLSTFLIIYRVNAQGFAYIMFQNALLGRQDTFLKLIGSNLPHSRVPYNRSPFFLAGYSCLIVWLGDSVVFLTLSPCRIMRRQWVYLERGLRSCRACRKRTHSLLLDRLQFPEHEINEKCHAPARRKGKEKCVYL